MVILKSADKVHLNTYRNRLEVVCKLILKFKWTVADTDHQVSGARALESTENASLACLRETKYHGVSSLSFA